MKIIEVAKFIPSESHLAATVQFVEGKKPRIIGRSGYTDDKKADRLAIREAKKLRLKQ